MSSSLEIFPLTLKTQLSISISLIYSTQNITLHCLLISQQHNVPFHDDIFLSHKLDARQWGRGVSLPYLYDQIRILSTMICSAHSYLTSPIIFTFIALIWSALFDLILLLLFNLFALIRSTQFRPLWSDLIQSDSIQSNLICSLLFDTITMIWSDPIYFAHSSPIKSAHSLALPCSDISNTLLGTYNFSLKLTLG